MSLKKKIKRALGSKTTYTKKENKVKKAIESANLKKGTQSMVRSRKPNVTKITEDNPLWDEKTMGNKKGSKRKVLKQYGDKGYRPSTGKGVGM